MKVRLLVGASIAAVAGCALVWLSAEGRLSTLFGRGHESSATANDSPEVVWLFEAPEHGAIVSSPLVEGDRIFVGVIHDVGLTTYGAVYCIDRKRGKPIWKFDNGGQMLHMFSSPCLANGRLYIGEGMHENFFCRLYCLDADSGRKLWDFPTAGHVESSPCVADGDVFFGAGDDGLYCLDGKTGSERWRFQEKIHVDTSPLVVADRVYAGSGRSERYNTSEIFCLDRRTGQALWRVPTDLPVWGSPAALEDAVFFGLGNGRLLEPPPVPAKPTGSVLCVHARTGKELWRWTGSDAVFCKPVPDIAHVYFGSRDGNAYCLNRQNGQLQWKVEMRSPIVGRPVLLNDRLYMAASGGQVFSLATQDGQTRWSFDIAAHSRMQPRIFSSPALVREEELNGVHHLLFLGTELAGPAGSSAVLYCLRD